jgi:hypothetical protein
MKNTNLQSIKNQVSLPDNLHNILIGIMLGDGSIYRSSATSNCRFEMSFGTNYKQFAESIGILFKEYIKDGIKELKIKGKDKVYINYRLKSLTLPLFNKYHAMFYQLNTETGKYVKIVPLDILNLMNPVVLAYLIMTDGNFDKNRNRIRIYTNCYSKDSVEKLANSINANLDIYVGVLHDRNNQ